MNSGSLVFVGIAPHPPVMVPGVGGASAEEVRDSIEAMRELTERINACGAETVVLISPHAPLEERAFVAYDGPRLRGDFANFRAPHATVDVPLDAELLDAIVETAKEEGKPEQALPKIVEGRLGGFFKDVVLLEQASVSDNKKTVKALLDEASVTVTRFVRFEVGQQ